LFEYISVTTHAPNNLNMIQNWLNE